MRGENILNGGFGALIAIVGRPNVFKTTIAHFMTLGAAHNVADAGYEPYINTYDTEMNIHTSRLLTLAQKFVRFAHIDIIMSGIWKITDATKHLGEDWYKKLKDHLREEKIKNRKKYLMQTPFMDKKGEPIYTIFPTFGQLDSITKFVTSDIEEISNKNEIGESGGNMIFARSGLGKARLIMELPGLCNAAAHYMICTAHVADINTMGMQPHQQPAKKLQHMRMGEKIKGVPDDVLFLTNSLWQATSSVVFFNNGTKCPEYPKTRDTKDEDSVDLNKVTMKLIRNKSGPSGYTFDLLVSQVDGVLSSLSEFHHIKENGRYGLEGNNTNYHLAILPDVNITRTTVRELLDTNAKLRRAVKLTADIYHITLFYKDLPFEIPSMTDLHAKLEKEYGWDVLLNTRDNWTFNQYEHETPFLSGMDLLEMYHGIRQPYWFSSKKEKVTK
ncbi:hypothetical protein [Flavobacterium sp.]|uniref:hypothetical protein n=1 Tax=Flavobacterium sp. TaxID=239 RepID=UPI0037BFDD9E